MSHGFDITHELLVMDWHFQGYFVFSCIIIFIGQTRFL